MRIAAIAFAAIAMFASIGSASANEMRTGGKTSQPRGHWELCQTRPVECTARTRDTRTVAMNGDVMRVLRAVNDRVNRAVYPMTDLQQHGIEERWSYPGSYGDCEDYVLAKRQMLLGYGFKPGDLLITVAQLPNGEVHAVLSVRTDRGEYVLDNVDRRVLHWTETSLRYIKRQSTTHAGTWVAIRGGVRVAMR